MAAIALAAEVLRRRHPDEDLVVGSFAADHLIADEPAFTSAVTRAVAAARHDYLVAIGIAPDEPSTAFGYIRVGAGGPVAGVEPVEDFVEKPSPGVAAGYLAAGGYLWNAGMYLCRAERLRELLRRYQPALAAGIEEIAAAWDGPERAEVLERVWPGLPAIAIDHALSEPLSRDGGVAVVPADLGWSDIGDWDAIATALPEPSPVQAPPSGGRGAVRVLGPAGSADRVRAYGAEGSVVVPGEATVVVLGIPGAVVVNTGDAILVTTRDRAQHLKQVVDDLPREGPLR
ncbi:sugar phosphate nucleotidyltransferase [Pseudactinotalea sp. HY158]|uniref:sugar phosphate nucleotidyltransferase n=1 Tax=Pseudactinotalea sp. HY158 TaxID=2654547 RepID=UPI00351A3C5B